jgi:hypothetical protein
MIRLIDLLKENTNLNKLASTVADKVNCDYKGSCVGFAELFVLAAYKEDPKLLDTFDVIEGYVMENGRKLQHTWIETKSGQKIDPTFAQFKDGSEYSSQVKSRYGGKKYFNDTIKFNKLDIDNIDTNRMTVGKWYKK